MKKCGCDTMKMTKVACDSWACVKGIPDGDEPFGTSCGVPVGVILVLGRSVLRNARPNARQKPAVTFVHTPNGCWRVVRLGVQRVLRCWRPPLAHRALVRAGAGCIEVEAVASCGLG